VLTSFFVRLGTRRLTVDSSVLLLRKTKVSLQSGFGLIVDFFRRFQALVKAERSEFIGEP
jgi:hypothetical protein